MENQFEDDTVYVLPSSDPEPGASSTGPRPNATAPSSRRVNLLHSLRRHPVAAFLGFLLVTVLSGAFIGYRNTRDIYLTEALLIVAPAVPRPAIEDREVLLPRYDEFINQQVASIQREETTMDALERLGDRLWKLPDESRREAAARLSAVLKTQRVAGTAYISISLEGPQPDGLAEIVNGVVDAHLTRERGHPFATEDNRQETLNKRREELHKKISEKTQQLTQWAKEFGILTLEARSDDTSLSSGSPLFESRTRRLSAQARIGELELRHGAQRGVDLEPEARDLLGTDPELVALRTSLLARKNEIRTRLAGLTLEHVGRKSSEAIVASLDEELEKSEKEALQRHKSALERRRDIRQRDERMTAESELRQTTAIEETLLNDEKDQRTKAARFSGIYYDVLTARQELERLNRQLAAVEDRLDVLRMEARTPSFISVASPALKPEAPKPKKTFPMIAMSLFAAFGAAFALPLVLDMTDQRIHTPQDVENILEARVMGWLLERKPQTEAFVHDQLRRLALSLDRERRLFNRSQFVFTSLRPGGGTTPLVLDLARALRAVGARVVVVEANALNPDPRLAAADGTPGLATVLAGGARIEEAILPAHDTLPDVIPIGDTGGRSHLPGCRNVRPMLDRLTSRYEIVLLDAPPILYSSDAELLASGAHAAILVVEAERVLTGEVKRAIQILRQVGPPVVEAVVTRVRDQGGLGYYSDLLKQYEAAGRPRSS